MRTMRYRPQRHRVGRTKPPGEQQDGVPVYVQRWLLEDGVHVLEAFHNRRVVRQQSWIFLGRRERLKRQRMRRMLHHETEAVQCISERGHDHVALSRHQLFVDMHVGVLPRCDQRLLLVLSRRYLQDAGVQRVAM